MNAGSPMEKCQKDPLCVSSKQKQKPPQKKEASIFFLHSTQLGSDSGLGFPTWTA